MWLKILITCSCVCSLANAMSQSFVNSSSGLRPTFVVNFDISSVICQTSASQDDLKIFPISVLCDGKKDCFENPAMDDETFPYCSHKCINDCGKHGVCLMDGGRSLCYCDDGYNGKKCEIKGENECSKKPCHWLARCTNTFGSYYCTCLPGFEGDGHNCTDIDECADPKVALHCPANAKCCNIPGSFFCNCTDGFAPKGSPISACIDIDECADGSAKCKENETCVNTNGSYHCVSSSMKCSIGFEEKNGECHDINECLRPNDCDQRSECINTKGSYLCVCIKGFTGTGKICTPLFDCSQQPSICHKNAFCVTDLKMCLCQNGFIGDGITCYDMNECLTEPSVCKSNEKCLNLEGSFVCCSSDQNFDECKKAKGLTCKLPCGFNAECRRGDCVCKDGFVGDPMNGCSDRNECALNRTICPTAHWCVNLDGSYMCCSDDAPLTLCRGLLIGVASEFNEIKPNVTTIDKSSITGSSSLQSTNLLLSTVPITSTQSSSKLTENSLQTSSSSHSTLAPSATITGSSSLQTTTPLLSTLPITSTSKLTESSLQSLSSPHSTLGASISATTASSSGSSASPLTLATKSDLQSTEKDILSSGSSTILSSTLITSQPIVGLTDKDSTISASSLATSQPIAGHTDTGSTITLSTPTSTSTSTSSHVLLTTVEKHSTGKANPPTTSIPCSEDRLKFCETRNMSCVIVNEESRCHGCAHGFVENDQGICVDGASKLVRCSQSTDCDGNANCIDINPSGHLCVCKSGFIGDGKRCDDVDECYSPNVCSPNAQCINSKGGYSCTCNAGFVGDGTTCTERLAGHNTGCAVHPDRCHEFAKCVNDECFCISGFLGNGTFCSKINSTSTDCVFDPRSCDPNAECIERHCQCRIGYLGDGLRCRPDPDDCHLNISLCGNDARCVARRCRCLDAQPSCRFADCSTFPTLCHSDAECVGKLCRCRNGFEGNGTFCRSLTSTITSTSSTIGASSGSSSQTGSVHITTAPGVDNCENFPSVCHRNAKCLKDQCICDDGYVGNGRSCIPDPNDCKVYPRICHPNATCISKMHCKCKPMFVGDGIANCEPLKPEDNCALTPKLCNEHASCVDFACKCNNGFAGDGKTCILNTTDCSVAPSMCNEKASCVDSKCVCNKGFDGNGIVCRTVDQFSCQFNSTVCDANADCVSERCICRPGFVGSGFACRRESSTDCSLNPDLCHSNAVCVKGQCVCKPDFAGNGTICTDLRRTNPVITSTAASSTVSTNSIGGITDPFASTCSESVAKSCHKSAECIREGSKEECRCHAGFSGDGKIICEDINECSLRLVQCYRTATCVNTLGSFMCLCPSGQKGDGINNCLDVTKEPEAIDVECERDGLTLVLNNRRDFSGKMFVKNQSLNPKCSKNFTTDDGPVYKFTAPFAFCDVRMEAHHTFSTVVVVQKHPLFVTDGDEAFNLRCTYPAGELMLMSHFNVSMLSTVDTLSKDGPPPQCTLSVLASGSNQSVAEAIVGQQLQLRLTVEPQITYGILAKNCVAVNMENGETYKLTDTNGCSVDTSIFPEWSQLNKSQLFVNFLTFKWPDTAQIRFQCDCSPCFDQCDAVKCGKNQDTLAWGRKRRSVAYPPIENQVYSNVVQVRDSDKLLAQENVDDSGESLENGDYSKGSYFASDDANVCVNSGLLAAALGLAVSMAAIITVTTICRWQQRSGGKYAERGHTVVAAGYENRTFSTVESSVNGGAVPSTKRRSNVHKRACNQGFTETWSS